MSDVNLICLHCSEGQVQVRANQGLCVRQNDLLICHGYLSCIVSVCNLSHVGGLRMIMANKCIYNRFTFIDWVMVCELQTRVYNIFHLD